MKIWTNFVSFKRVQLNIKCIFWKSNKQDFDLFSVTFPKNGTGCPKLRYLSLDCCISVTDQALWYLLQHNPLVQVNQLRIFCYKFVLYSFLKCTQLKFKLATIYLYCLFNADCFTVSLLFTLWITLNFNYLIRRSWSTIISRTLWQRSCVRSFLRATRKLINSGFRNWHSPSWTTPFPTGSTFRAKSSKRWRNKHQTFFSWLRIGVK